MGGAGSSYDLGFKGSKPYVAINDGSGWGEYITDSALPINEWHHLSGVRNNEDDLVIYIDGVVNKTFSGVRVPQAVTTDLYLGRRGFADYEFVGLIDEVKIWNTNISEGEAYQQYASNLNKFNSTQWYLYVNQSKNSTTGLDEASYNYYAYARNNALNSNQTETRTITISSGTLYPIFSNYYDNNASINSSGDALFNVTVTNTNGTVLLTINGSNYHASNLTSNVYNLSISGLINGIIFTIGHLMEMEALQI